MDFFIDVYIPRVNNLEMGSNGRPKIVNIGSWHVRLYRYKASFKRASSRILMEDTATKMFELVLIFHVIKKYFPNLATDDAFPEYARYDKGWIFGQIVKQKKRKQVINDGMSLTEMQKSFLKMLGFNTEAISETVEFVF